MFSREMFLTCNLLPEKWLQRWHYLCRLHKYDKLHRTVRNSVSTNKKMIWTKRKCWSPHWWAWMYLVLIGAECGQHYRRRRRKETLETPRRRCHPELCVCCWTRDGRGRTIRNLDPISSSSRIRDIYFSWQTNRVKRKVTSLLSGYYTIWLALYDTLGNLSQHRMCHFIRNLLQHSSRRNTSISCRVG